jgi:hypothetical protein
MNEIFELLVKQGLQSKETSDQWYTEHHEKTPEELDYMLFQVKQHQIDIELNYYEPKCFCYSLKEMPSEKFDTEEKTLFFTYDFKHFCYDPTFDPRFLYNVNTEKALKLYGNKAYFKIVPEANGNYITYGDIFIQSDKQFVDYLTEWIKKENIFIQSDKQFVDYLTEWIKKEKEDIDYQDLLCSHRFMEAFSKTTPIQYSIWCGS